MAKEKPKTVVPKLRFPEFREAEGWSVKRLGGIAQFTSGGTPSKDEPKYWSGNIPWISASSMYETLIANSELKVTSLAIGNGTRLAPKGNVLILVRGSMLFNRVPIGIATIDVAFNQDVKALALVDEVEKEFVLHQLIASSSRMPINETGIGAGKIETDILTDWPIFLPSLNEQQKITDCLTSLDELIAAQGRKLEALKTYKRGLMQQLFPREGETVPRLRFPEFKNAPGWKMSVLGRVCKMQAGKFVEASAISEARESGRFPCYGGNGLRGFTKTYTHSGRYPLIGRQGALCGNVKFAEGEFHATEHAIVSTPNDGISVDWLFCALGYLQLNQFATGQAQPGLSVEVLEKVELKVPISEHEQQRVADCIFSIESRIFLDDTFFSELKNHKQALMQQLFPSVEEP